MKKFWEACYKNAEPKGSFTVSPCLRPKGHKGKHEHEKYCNAWGCMCGALFKRMSMRDYNRYEELKKVVKRIDVRIDGILKKYHVAVR